MRRRALTAESHRPLGRDGEAAPGAVPLSGDAGASPPTPDALRAYAPDPARYRLDHAGWVSELDLSVTSAHVRMGIRTLDGADWLVADERAQSELALRRRLLSEQRDLVFACRGSAEGAADETAELVDDWRRARGQRVQPPDDEFHPLARTGLAIQEDLCLMVRRDGAWHLDGAMLCFPSMWSLGAKLGSPMAGIHGPVDHYPEELSSKADTFLDRLKPGGLVWRRNLSVWPCCLLFVPTPDLDTSLWDPPPPPGRPRLWLRSERQTLRRLPASGAILFTIKVQMTHLETLEDQPARAGALAAWLRGPGGESRRRQLGQLLGPDLAWLDGVDASASA